MVRFARDEWRARLLRLSFEQHLAPEVVRRIAADPAALRLRGEMREITALFTDIEGFTSMTERAEPADLVALLDTYFDVATRIITDHGGMIDKIVGDAIHAIYNAPFELEDHAAALSPVRWRCWKQPRRCGGRRSVSGCSLAVRASGSRPGRRSSVTWAAAESSTTPRTATR